MTHRAFHVLLAHDIEGARETSGAERMSTWLQDSQRRFDETAHRAVGRRNRCFAREGREVLWSFVELDRFGNERDVRERHV